MALNRTTASGGSRVGQTAPLWLTVLFLGGLVALYLGQRVVVKWEGVATAFSGLGLAATLAASAARFTPMFKGDPSHARIARLLSLLQLIGVVSLALYFATTETGSAWLGLDQGLEPSRVVSVLHVLWVVGLAVSSAGLLFAEFALNPMRGADHIESPRVYAAAISGATLALGATYGALFVYAAAQEEAQADFSYFKTSEPGEATVKLVQRAAKPIKVTAFFPDVSQVKKEVSGYLSQLQKKAGNLEVKVTDRYLDPTLANQLNVVSDGVVVVSQDDSNQILIVGADIDKARAKLTKFDSEFYTKLGKLINSRHTAYFTVGHGELNDPDPGADKPEGRGAEVAKKLLEQQNYKIKDLGLSQGLANRVPDDADLVLVLGPTLAFAPEEIATLKRYADSGGKLMLALDVDNHSTREVVSATKTVPAASASGAASASASGAPAASASAAPAATPPNEPARQWVVDLAAAVGATLVPTVLADEQQYVVRRNDASDRVILPTNRFSSHASVTTLSRNSARTGVVVLGAAHLLESEQGGVKPQVALRTLGSAFGDDNRDYKLDGTEERKSYNLAVALTHPVEHPVGQAKQDESKPAASTNPENDDPESGEPAAGDKDKKAKADAPPEMRAFVLADADALSDLLMERVPGNQMLLVDAVRWLVGDESLAGELQSEEDVRIEQTKQQDLAWFYSLIFGVPAGVLVLGWWLSRRARSAAKTSKAPSAKPDESSMGAQA
ncbi:MAG TPA: Gldg family protein [Polyangiaceae bacterium]|nr:Gldg family protein [Polyangiaceae bacterium]